MSVSVKIEDELYAQAKVQATAEHRSIAGQIEYRAKVGRAALDNPDLQVSFIAESLLSMDEPREQATPFMPRSLLAILATLEPLNEDFPEIEDQMAEDNR